MKLWVSESDRKPEPEPIESNAKVAVLLGIAAWTIALVLVLFFGDSFAGSIPSWWTLCCVFGISLGIFGFFKVRGR